MLNRAIDWKWIKAEQQPSIERARKKRKRIRVLSDELADALMEAATADQDGRLWLFVSFALGAAMR